MTVVEMIEEMIRVNSPKKFEGILDNASLKELNQHYERMSSSVEETKITDLWGDVWEEAMRVIESSSQPETDKTDVVQIRPGEVVYFKNADVYYTITNLGKKPVLVRSPIVEEKPSATSSFNSYSIHTGEIKI